MVDAGAANWKNVNGTGPFKLTDYVQGNSNTYEKNPDYWDKETINEKEFKLPYVDKIIYRIIKDEATRVTALRTGKLDIMECMRWQDAEQLKKSTPDLKWNKWLATSGTFLSMRVDQKPFDDIRVRRAMNLAVNKDEIIKAYYNGNAELFAYPQHPEYGGYFQPLNEQPASVQELFKFDPAKAKKLLAEAGYPNGFTFKTQVCSCSPDHMDLHSAGLGLSRAGRHQDGNPADGVCGVPVGDDDADQCGRLFHEQRPHQPDDDDPQELSSRGRCGIRRSGTIRSSLRAWKRSTGEDEAKRQAELRAMTTEMLDNAPYVWLPTPYNFTAWWPWVKGL